MLMIYRAIRRGGNWGGWYLGKKMEEERGMDVDTGGKKRKGITLTLESV